jgi:hypothetical protein
MPDEKYNPKTCEWHREDLDQIMKDMYGNGQEGILVRFARMETRAKLMLTIELLLLSGVAALVLKVFTS